MLEKRHVLEVLRDVKDAIKDNDVIELKTLSNKTVHSASANQDTDSIMIAVLIYSISKIMEKRPEGEEKTCGEFCRIFLKGIDSALKSLQNDDEKGFTDSLQSIMDYAKKASPDIRRYINDVFFKAKINKASKIYEHGISMEQTAKLLGITMYELASYAGERGISDTPLAKTQSVQDRIKLAMNFFR